MNPCPCGWHGSSLRSCRCAGGTVRRYRARLSGPLLDRFDLQVPVPQVDYRALSEARSGEASAVVRERVVRARRVQSERLRGTRLRCNAELPPRLLARACRLDAPLTAELADLADRRGLTARGVHRLLRVARTLADLAGREAVSRADVFAAADFRFLDTEVL
jgi:magnesium chelatase family protein